MSKHPSSILQGLTQAEAEAQLLKFGPNEIEEKKGVSIGTLWVRQFHSPLVVLLLGAAALAFALGETFESGAIGVIVLLNAMIGFLQEYRAETAINALKKMTSPRAKVLRDGRQTMIASVQVVPGDLLFLEAGDLVPADAELVQTSRLQVNEAVLTGESEPVEKQINKAGALPHERTQMVFTGTSVVTGTAQATVTATGMATELGKIAHLITTAQTEPTPLQAQINHLGKMLLWICLAVAGLVMILGLLQQKPYIELLVFSVSLAVAAVPEGLPAIVTVALAMGIQRMATRHALVRRLHSVETLGSVSVICTDKTGTLTTGKMRVRELWGENHTKLLTAAVSCCDAELDPDGPSGTGDATEIAILIEARQRGILKDTIEKNNPRISTEPFDSTRKRMSVARADGTLFVKGAIETLLALSADPPERIRSFKENADQMSLRGLRVLAIAAGKGRQETNLHLEGLIAIADPPRTEAIEAIAEARKAGIIPIMITGDHPGTAQAIAREIGLVLETESTDGRVHARALPEDKLKLVRQWKSKGMIVAMTGDGVNDAPALREAHVGIAMGRTGTEVTRQSADILLADDNFSTIVAAIREGRGTYQNIRKAILYFITGNLSELLIVFSAATFMLPLPFTAAHLLWINLVTDSLPGLALIMDPISQNVMSKKPRPTNERILGRKQWLQIAWGAIVEATTISAVYYFQLKNVGPESARNFAFTTLVFSQMWRAFSARSQTRIFWEVGYVSNLWLLSVVLLTSALQLSLHFIPFTQKVFELSPLNREQILTMVLISFIPASVIEIQKLFRRILRRY